ncbi:MAG: hypothetical protein AB1498_01425 [bacterium]
MKKGTKKQKNGTEEKKPEIKIKVKKSCGCGCITPVKTKQTNKKESTDTYTI